MENVYDNMLMPFFDLRLLADVPEKYDYIDHEGMKTLTEVEKNLN